MWRDPPGTGSASVFRHVFQGGDIAAPHGALCQTDRGVAGSLAVLTRTVGTVTTGASLPTLLFRAAQTGDTAEGVLAATNHAENSAGNSDQMWLVSLRDLLPRRAPGNE
jgi:hypothetical protein